MFRSYTQPTRKQRETARAKRNAAVAESVRTSPRSSATCTGGTSGQAVVKETIVRSEAYLRLVAALPCAHCRIEGLSQAAHPPPTAKSRKECDLSTFPLCCTRPGVPGCHVAFDQYRLFPAACMREQATTWGRQTRAAIRRSGQWPKNIEDHGK